MIINGIHMCCFEFRTVISRAVHAAIQRRYLPRMVTVISCVEYVSVIIDTWCLHVTLLLFDIDGPKFKFRFIPGSVTLFEYHIIVRRLLH